MIECLQALSQWPFAVALRESSVAYPLANAAHILAIGLIVGTTVALDLRLLGLFRSYELRALGPPLARIAAAGVILAAITGFLLFIVQPVTYVRNEAFLIKLGLVGLGIANAAILHGLPHWRRALAGQGVARTLKLSALLSLLIWVAAVVAGRWIGFL